MSFLLLPVHVILPKIGREVQGEIEVTWDPSVSCLCSVRILEELYKSLPCLSQVLCVFVNGKSKVREPLPVGLLVAIRGHVFLQSELCVPKIYE